MGREKGWGGAVYPKQNCCRSKRKKERERERAKEGRLIAHEIKLIFAASMTLGFPGFLL